MKNLVLNKKDSQKLPIEIETEFYWEYHYNYGRNVNSNDGVTKWSLKRKENVIEDREYYPAPTVGELLSVLPIKSELFYKEDSKWEASAPKTIGEFYTKRGETPQKALYQLIVKLDNEDLLKVGETPPQS